MEETGAGAVIFHGRYRFNAGAYRPSLTVYVLATNGSWVKHSFLLDTGADMTFLPQSSLSRLGISTTGINVKNDVGEAETPAYPGPIVTASQFRTSFQPIIVKTGG